MKHLALLSLSTLICAQLFSQKYYHFSELQIPYEPLEDAIQIVDPDFKNDKLTELPLTGQLFNFFGTPFNIQNNTKMYVQTYGDIRIDDDTSTVIIDGVFTSLTEADSTTKISYKIVGQSGHKIVKVEWKKVSLLNGQSGNFSNFQIWIHQKHGVIELRYGDRSTSNGPGFLPTTGPYAGMFHSNSIFNKLYEKLWLYDDPNNIKQDSSAAFAFKALSGLPPNGTVWRFTPKMNLDSISIGIHDEGTQSNVAIFPNPAHDYLYFNNLIITNDEVYEIYNLHGKLIETGFLMQNEIDLSNIMVGIYTVRLPSIDKQFRFIKH